MKLHEKKDNSKWNKEKVICIIGTLNWIVLSGFRSVEIGADTKNYQMYFNQTLNTSWNELLKQFIDKYRYSGSAKDPGYNLLVKLFQIISNDYQLFLLVVALVFMIPMGIYIYHYSRNPYISFLLFSTLFYSFFSITGIRQTIATSICVWLGYKFIKERRLMPFIIVVLISSTVHFSSLLFLPFYWISTIKISYKSILIYWSLIITSYIFRFQIFSQAGSISGYTEYGYDSNEIRAGTFFYLMIIILIILTIWYPIIIANSSEIISVSINALFIAGVFLPLLLVNANSMRMIQYYSLFLLFLLPEFETVFENKNRIIYKSVIVFALIGLLILNNPQYLFFWERR